jgi:glycosyltransferase involved in cell wall biosynthesis
LLIEAISTGLPVIVCDTPETRSRFADEKNVFLVRNDKPRAIARALMKIIEDKIPSE